MAEVGHRKRRILIIGHSFIRRLDAFVESRTESASGRVVSRDFWLENTDVKWMSLSGGKVSNFDQMCKALPTVDDVYLELGSNDLCELFWEPEIVALRIVGMASVIRNRANARHIIVGEPLPRVFNPPNIPYNQCLGRYLDALRHEVANTPHMSTWAHVRLVNRHCPEYFAKDGHHLSPYGMYLHFKSIRGALTATKGI